MLKSLFNPRVSLGCLATLLAMLTLVLATPVVAEDGVTAAKSPITVPNPAADLWRAVRKRQGDVVPPGNSQVRGVESAVLINSQGENFRQYRRQDFIGNAGLVIAGIAALIAVFYLVRGRIPIEGGRSGRRIRRFADFDRTMHWLTAILFIFLGLTGLTLLFGRFVLLPVFGPELFSVVASASKEGHNLFGPLFLVSLIILILRLAWRNMPARGDLKWIFKGGGILTKGHVSAGFFNAGEKIWFWSVTVFGLVVCISGLVLDFPVFGQGRDIMQLALVVHGIAAVLLIAGSFGHIYIGTLGTEGSLESMTTGYVDENWAKCHHDRWLEEVKQGEKADDRNTAQAGGTPVTDRA